MTYLEKATEYVLHAKEYWGLEEWDVWVSIVEAQQPSAAEVDRRYLRAVIRVTDGLNDAQLAYAVNHEVTHIALSGMYQIFKGALDLLDPPVAEMLRELFANEEENFIERLRRAQDGDRGLHGV